MTTADRVIEALASAGLRLACAESLTGGQLCATFVGVPGASAVIRGGVVAYATDVKASVLAVPEALLAQRGAVDPEVAGLMASGVLAALQADIGVATTGVAGPEPTEGKPVGLVYLAVAWREGLRGAQAGFRAKELRLTGERDSIRAASCQAAIDLVSGFLAGDSDAGYGRDMTPGAAPGAAS